MSRNSGQQTNNKSSFAHRQGVFKGANQKKYQKVVGNQSEGQGYADKRKRKVVNQYRRDRKKLLQDTPSAQPLYTPSRQEAPKTEPPSRQAIGQFPGQISHKEKLHREKFQSGQDHRQNRGPKSSPPKNRFWQAEQEHKHTEAAHQKKREEYIESQEKQQAALKVYKDKKRARNKKLSKKTQRGQPVMKHQIDHLLDKLKNMQD